MSGDDTLSFFVDRDENGRDEVSQALADSGSRFEQEGLICVQCAHDFASHRLLLWPVFHAKHRLEPAAFREGLHDQIEQLLWGRLRFDLILKTYHSRDERFGRERVESKSESLTLWNDSNLSLLV